MNKDLLSQLTDHKSEEALIQMCKEALKDLAQMEWRAKKLQVEQKKLLAKINALKIQP